MSDGMATINIKRVPVNKYALQAGDYQLWLNGNCFASIPNTDNTLSFEISEGQYTVQIKKAPLMSSELVEFNLSSSEIVNLTTGNAVDPNRSFFAGLMGCLIYYLYREYFKALDNAWCALVILLFAVILQLYDMKFKKLIFITVEKVEE
jgi:hypothetical protein